VARFASECSAAAAFAAATVGCNEHSELHRPIETGAIRRGHCTIRHSPKESWLWRCCRSERSSRSSPSLLPRSPTAALRDADGHGISQCRRRLLRFLLQSLPPRWTRPPVFIARGSVATLRPRRQRCGRPRSGR
jgi:hypothetical protein